MKQTVENLQSKKETLVEEKKMSLSRRDELRVQWKSQEEMREKRLQNKLNRDKSEAVKNLISDLEIFKESNQEMTLKLTTEIQNYDKLLKEKMTAEYDLLLLEKRLDEDTK